MNRILYVLMMMATLVSCADQYNIQGSSSVASLDGSKLYLKTVKDGKLTSIDSCEVVHGKFKFAGLLDTTMMVNLFMDDRPLMMPIVLEQGNIVVRIDDTSRKVSGTPLNDSLYHFLDLHNQLDSRMVELNHRESQMLLDGIDELTIREQLSAEAKLIAAEEDSLVTNFIISNFDNVLGPGVFMMVTAGYQYPILNDQIEFIMAKATDAFKNDPYVKQYYKAASDNQAQLLGIGNTAPAATAEPSDSLIQNILDGKE